MTVIENNGSRYGTKIIDDSKDYVVPQNSAVQGINNTIVFQNGFMIKRDITVECRSDGALAQLMMALADPDGVVVEGGQYVVLNVSPVESFGVSDSGLTSVYTYRIELVVA